MRPTTKETAKRKYFLKLRNAWAYRKFDMSRNTLIIENSWSRAVMFAL